MLPQCLYYYSLRFSMLLIDSLSFFSKKQHNLLTTFTVSHCFNFFLLNFLQMLRDFFKKKSKYGSRSTHWDSLLELCLYLWFLFDTLNEAFWYDLFKKCVPKTKLENCFYDRTTAIISISFTENLLSISGKILDSKWLGAMGCLSFCFNMVASTHFYSFNSHHESYQFLLS